MNLRNLNPKQKKILAALGVAGVLALVVMLGRRSGAATTAPDAAQLGATGAASGVPTFADNGAAAGGLSTDLTGAFGGLQQSIADLPAQVVASLPVQQAPADVDVPGIVAAAIVAAGANATPSGTKSSSVKAATAATKTTALFVTPSGAPLATSAQVALATKAGASRQSAITQHNAAIAAAKKAAAKKKKK